MAEKKKKKDKKTPRPSSKILGKGLAEKAASAAEKRRKKMEKLLKSIN